MDPRMSLDAGREMAETILREYGFEDVRFEAKAVTSKYYASGQEEEVFAEHRGQWFEIADIGMYSPISLANFGINSPVFNAGFGVERLLMVLNRLKDIRGLVYPQFAITEFSDREIARSITYVEKPETDRGKQIARAIEETARRERDATAPCEFMGWEDNKVEVRIVEKEEGKRLIGPAGFNEICVKNGSIYSDLAPSGSYAGVNYMRAISMGAATRIEKAEGEVIYEVKMARALSDINLKIPPDVRLYMQGRHKEFKIGGPVFVTIVATRKESAE